MFWEHYGAFARGEFDNIHYDNSVRYRVTILKKNYNFGDVIKDMNGNIIAVIDTDPVVNLLFGRDPVVIRTLNDDVFGIKGSEAILNIINKDSTLPLVTFYAEEEDEFKILVEAVYKDSGNVTQTKTIFIGFLVQEDSTEILTDITHEIRLTFTDNLGTLKNLSFGDAAKTSPTSSANLRTFTTNTSLIPESLNTSAYLQLNTNIFSGNPAVGDYLFINDSPVGDAAYTIIKIEDVAGTRRLYLREKVLGYTNVNVNISIITGSNPFSRLTLADVIRICLQGTNLLLDFRFGSQIYANNINLGLPLSMIIDGKTFLSGEDNWVSCYDVLQSIADRFSASLYQSEGKWYMTRWNELRYQNNQIIHTIYSNYLTTSGLTEQYPPNTIGKVEAGMEESILRPYNFYKETFNYKENTQLLYNANFQILGPKVRQNIVTISGISYTYNEYEAVGFIPNPLQTTLHEAIIRVVSRNDTNEETDRYLIIKGFGVPVGSQLEAPYLTTPIEVNQGDRLKITMSLKMGVSTNLTGWLFFKIKSSSVSNYITNSVIDNTDPIQNSWNNSSFTSINRNFNNSEFIEYVIETAAIPLNGIFQIHLDAKYVGSNDSAFYKNLKVEIINTSRTNATIKGHERKTIINKIVKNNETKEIKVDFSNKNTINGTLFTNTFSNLVQIPMATVRDYTGSSWNGNLGELTTRQMIDWKCLQRVKLEGKLLGIYKSSFQWLNLHQALIFSIKSGKYFIFGKAVYNLKEDFIEATLYEMWKDGEERTNVTDNNQLDYEFKYLY